MSITYRITYQEFSRLMNEAEQLSYHELFSFSDDLGIDLPRKGKREEKLELIEKELLNRVLAAEETDSDKEVTVEEEFVKLAEKVVSKPVVRTEKNITLLPLECAYISKNKNFINQSAPKGMKNVKTLLELLNDGYSVRLYNHFVERWETY